MILSVSRRTDIPAYYSEWFYNRLIDGSVMVRNPYNLSQVNEICLSPENIECIVFWTKNPNRMMEKLHLLNNYKYYFQFTITPYNNKIEKNLPEKARIITTFINLSKTIGKGRIVWRYDPIILSNELTAKYHEKEFEAIASKLEGYSQKCVISFLDMYPKIVKNINFLKVNIIKQEQMMEIGEKIVIKAKKYGYDVQACAEAVDLTSVGIKPGSCIDGDMISSLTGNHIELPKDSGQRNYCRCVPSIDIGVYNTCKNNCVYCYANSSNIAVNQNFKNHNPNSPFLIGTLSDGDKIYKKNYSLKSLNHNSVF